MGAPKDLMRRMASVVGHELRNPLAVIGNSAYFVKAKLTAGGGLDPKVEKHLGIIESEIRRADGLIGDILAYSRELELKVAPCSLGELAEEVLGAYSLPKGVKLVKKLAVTGEVVADAERLKVVLKKILDNAVEAMADWGTLSVRAFSEKDFVGLEISDTGSGIAPEILNDVFLPFYTTKPRGLGLGLALARKIVEAHKGRIELKGLGGKGVAVRILLPRL